MPNSITMIGVHKFSFSTRLVGRLHVLNLRQEAAENSDYEVTVEDIVNYENKYGKIRPGSIVSTDHWSLYIQLILYNDLSIYMPFDSN